MTASVRHDWSFDEVKSLYEQPFNDLLFRAQTVHRQHFDPNAVQVSTLLSIKTGACPEDCKYCSQSGHYNTELEKEKLMAVEKVLKEARQAKTNGASRFCMGAAWKHPSARDFPHVLAMVKGVRELGLETCMTLGALSQEQSEALAAAGLDYYNHNIDTSREYYKTIISTRSFDDRLQTLEHVRDAGIKVCCGGIVGMGENFNDRIGFLVELANLPVHAESVPINNLVKIKGTPLENVDDLDEFEFVRMIAVARILMPKSHVRLSAGREQMNDQMQALCFLAGANSIFYGEKLLTTSNPLENDDMQLFQRLGIHPEEVILDEQEPQSAQMAPESPAFYDATFDAQKDATVQ